VQAAQAPVCTFARSGKSAPLPPDKTVLEASEDVGVNIDNSCREGYCGVCKTKLLAGQVTMAVEDALDENDKAQNIILACQAKSTGDVTVEA
jgi:ferredoxin